eukprot:gene25897-biopygen15070
MGKTYHKHHSLQMGLLHEGSRGSREERRRAEGGQMGVRGGQKGRREAERSGREQICGGPGKYFSAPSCRHLPRPRGAAGAGGSAPPPAAAGRRRLAAVTGSVEAWTAAPGSHKRIPGTLLAGAAGPPRIPEIPGGAVSPALVSGCLWRAAPVAALVWKDRDPTSPKMCQSMQKVPAAGARCAPAARAAASRAPQRRAAARKAARTVPTGAPAGHLAAKGQR